MKITDVTPKLNRKYNIELDEEELQQLNNLVYFADTHICYHTPIAYKVIEAFHELGKIT